MDIEEQLGQFHWVDPDPDVWRRIFRKEKMRSPRLWRWRLAAAAAVLVAVGAGLWFWSSSGHDKHALLSTETPVAVEILGGRGRVTPVAGDARFTVLDSAKGHVRLDKGEVLVELDAGVAFCAEVETPAGTARAHGTCFYAHYSGADHSLLAVAVLRGKVEMATPHGQTTCSAGDVALARLGCAPHTHSGIAVHAGTHHRGFCPFVSTLGLVYRVDVQSELGLTDGQKTQLQRPDKDERREICRFFQSLHGATPEDWAAKTKQFCSDLEARVARILTPAQQKRLRQIAYQQEGFFALLRPELSRDFDVSAEQRKGLEKILRDFAETRRGLLDRGLPKAEWDEGIAETWQDALRDARTLLTASQQDAWQRLIGPPLDLRQEF